MNKNIKLYNKLASIQPEEIYQYAMFVSKMRKEGRWNKMHKIIEIVSLENFASFSLQAIIDELGASPDCIYIEDYDALSGNNEFVVVVVEKEEEDG